MCANLHRLYLIFKETEKLGQVLRAPFLFFNSKY